MLGVAVVALVVTLVAMGCSPRASSEVSTSTWVDPLIAVAISWRIDGSCRPERSNPTQPTSRPRRVTIRRQVRRPLIREGGSSTQVRGSVEIGSERNV